MLNNTASELTAGLFCVASACGRAHFTSDRQVALADAAKVRDRMRAAGASGVQDVRAQFLEGNSWLDCRPAR